jgi:hypothetical protein
VSQAVEGFNLEFGRKMQWHELAKGSVDDSLLLESRSQLAYQTKRFRCSSLVHCNVSGKLAQQAIDTSKDKKTKHGLLTSQLMDYSSGLLIPCWLDFI